MLKWAVYGKKNGDDGLAAGSRASYSNGPYASRTARRSLDAESIKRSRKPARYQRRSLGSAAIKMSNVKTVDKENINYVGNTPNFFKEGFVTKKLDVGKALKDVSNITPTATPAAAARTTAAVEGGARWHRTTEGNVPGDLTRTPSTYSRKIREAKKRKLEMTGSPAKDSVELGVKNILQLDNEFTNKENKVKSFYGNTEKVTNTKSNMTNFVLEKGIKKSNPVCTTKLSGDESIEIEYSSEYAKCRRELPLVQNKVSSADNRITLPIFGSKLFFDNPLYFNNNELVGENACPLKRTRTKTNDFESSFKSPSVDKQDVHELVRAGFSPLSVTPLSNKLSALRFSTVRCCGHDNKLNGNKKYVSNLIKDDTALSLTRDEEISTEMENKFIIPGEVTTLGSESTESDSHMGDRTLEKMIEDIIKSTKKVKNKRKLLHENQNRSKNALLSLQNISECKELVDNPVFVEPCAKIKTNLNFIREAKHVNLSRENSISPKSSPTKTRIIPEIAKQKNDFLVKLCLPTECERSFILDDCAVYNEREVKTPETYISIPPITELEKNKSTSMKVIERSISFSNIPPVKKILEQLPSESTPNIHLDTYDISKHQLKRQKCVRRKKSTVSESSWKKREVKRPQSVLTLETGIPSPSSTIRASMSISEPLSSSFNCLNGIPIHEITREANVNCSMLLSNQNSCNNSLQVNVSHSSMLLDQSSAEKPCRTKPMFGLTLENGIPSPITPIANLKRSNSNLSEERVHKTCKLDDEYPRALDALTPLIEFKTSRRCLTFSPEDGSINSSEEKRRSVASNRLERSLERAQVVKGTIDLDIVTRNGVIDVHVIRCRDLQRNCGKTEDINAYAKVVISGAGECQPLGAQRAVFQRTSVLYGRREPEFQRHLRLPLPPAPREPQLLHVSVWHRDKKYRRSEFLGCVSFPLKDAIKSDLSGCYYLQSQVSGRAVAVAATGSQSADVSRGTRARVTAQRDMATECAEAANTDDGEQEISHDKGAASNGPAAAVSSAHAALQREADEHLFLRYLELDPLDGADSTATPTPPPRRAASRQGRTPFTTTRRLSRQAGGGGGGFGFTVVWTRPPRVERVAAGGPAERAGLRAGDYLVFVGTRNVVVAPEDQVRQLVKAAGATLVLETFRRTTANGVVSGVAGAAGAGAARGSTASHVTCSDAEPAAAAGAAGAAGTAAGSESLAAPPSGSTVRPGTACSAATSQSLEAAGAAAARRKLHLPQVTFSKEAPVLTHEQQRRRALLAVLAREQHYASCLQFGLARFVAPLAERSDLITPADHQLLFQNIEEILRLSEDILEQLTHEDGEVSAAAVVAVYLHKTPNILSLYRKYCLGLKRADCVLVKKSRDPSGAFVRFCTSPPLPRRRPDITSLVHKPLEQFRELLRLMRAAAAAGSGGGHDHYERRPLQAIVDQLQNGYQEVTAGSGLMGLAGDGKPLLSVADLESRLVFTRCKPFVLGTPGRQWIFGGELSRVEGRTVKPYWALLFSDLLLFATVSRDRVLFITEEPVPLATVSDACFNVRKKATEFRLTLGRAGGESPLVSCSPRVLTRARSLALRAPSLDLKAVWQSLLQRQIYRVHTMSGTPLSSPLDSPDPQLAFSLATLDSQQRQTRRNSTEAAGGAGGSAEGGGGRGRGSGRGASLHLAHWMTQLPEREECEPPEQDLQTWSVEELRKRSKELNLIDVAGVAGAGGKVLSPHDKNDNERSPSKSSSGSQITVRTSPVVVDTIPVCRQCHHKCLSKPNSPLVSQRDTQESSKVIIEKDSPVKTNSNSNIEKSSCGNCHKSSFRKLERKGAMKLLNPKDAPQAALKVIDSIEQSQKRLKSTSYNFDNDSPLLGSRSSSSEVRNINVRALMERHDVRSPSPCASSRNASPLSTSHTTCSSTVFGSSAADLLANSPAATVQCVVAQEKYLNEVKCVENILLSKAKNNVSPSKRDKISRQKAENVLNKVLGMSITTKRENWGGCLQSSSVFLDDDSMHEDESDCKWKPRRSTLRRTTDLARVNGDIKKAALKEDLNANTNGEVANDDLEWGSLMLMGLTAINPAAHLMRVEPSALRRRGSLEFANATAAPSTPVVSNPPPNIAVLPPTPDYSTINRNDELIDDSPDSPQPEELPYVTLKRYGTMSSLERMPSDETDDGQQPRLRHEPEPANVYPAHAHAAGGLMGWTARAGSFVVEKMNIFSYTESDAAPTHLVAYKQPSFLERYLGVGGAGGAGGGGCTEEAGGGATEAGEGSAASGEEAWGTPSSGDLSDNAFPDSEHGTVSSPTKSTSSYAGDDDTELMMDELLLAPALPGPTLRPLLPRRRLEPLLEEDGSDSEGEDCRPTFAAPSTATTHQGSAQAQTQAGAGAPGHSGVSGRRRCRSADVCCAAPPPADSVSASEGGSGADGQCAGAACAGAAGDAAPDLSERSPDSTPTSETPSSTSRAGSRDSPVARWDAAGGAGAAAGGAGGAGRRGSASSASTPSTLERTAIHNPSPPPPSSNDNQTESEPEPAPSEVERLSPRAEMRLALDQGKDMLAEQDERWRRDGECDPWSWRAACRRSLVRRVASADAVTLCRPSPRPHPPLATAHAHRTAPDTTSRSSVYAWIDGDKLRDPTEMERLAQVEVRTMRSRTRSPCQNGKILGFLRRRASSDSPRRTELASLMATPTQRPFSPRRTTVSNNGYYKICFVNGSV